MHSGESNQLAHLKIEQAVTSPALLTSEPISLADVTADWRSVGRVAPDIDHSRDLEVEAGLSLPTGRYR